nr:recombinase zinc beta ribbon domain-containing protein [Hyphomicrobium sulfonivorans]
MLAGLARCGLCGAAMTRVYKGAKNGQPKLVCTVAKAKGGCSYQTVSVDAVEDAIAASVDFVVLGAPSGDDQLDAALERLETLRDAVSEQIWNVVDALALSSGSPSLRERLSLLETEQERLTNEHDALLTKIAATSGASVERRLEAVRAAIASEGDKAEINALLRQVLKGVVVDRASGRLRFLWKHGGESELMFAWPEDGGGD